MELVKRSAYKGDDFIPRFQASQLRLAINAPLLQNISNKMGDIQGLHPASRNIISVPAERVGGLVPSVHTALELFCLTA